MKPVKTVVGEIAMHPIHRILRHVPGGKNMVATTRVPQPPVPPGIIWKTVHAKRVTVGIHQVLV